MRSLRPEQKGEMGRKKTLIRSVSLKYFLQIILFFYPMCWSVFLSCLLAFILFTACDNTSISQWSYCDITLLGTHNSIIINDSHALEQKYGIIFQTVMFDIWCLKLFECYSITIIWYCVMYLRKILSNCQENMICF